nr:MAG TPA: hypothetical protein [Bacteriophage sp.]
MATNESAVMTSHNLLNYSGLLFNKGNTRTPFSTHGYERICRNDFP